MTVLEAENKALKQEVFLLQTEIANLKGLLFGAKRERFVKEGNPLQGSLFDLEDEIAEQQAVAEQPATSGESSRNDS